MVVVVVGVSVVRMFGGMAMAVNLIIQRNECVV